jgi:hypothetical protein
MLQYTPVLSRFYNSFRQAMQQCLGQKTIWQVIACNWLDILLWLVVVIALIGRCYYPYFNYNNPAYHLASDARRHFHSACFFGTEPFSLIEPIGYNLWLALIIKCLGPGVDTIGIYSALLSIFTAIIWYLWFRECLPSKRLALAGFAIIAPLPSWIGIYAFYMPETLLLPLFGLALYLTWRAKRVGSAASIFAALSAWLGTLLTKLSLAPIAIIAIVWLFIAIFKMRGKRFALSVGIPGLLLLSLTLFVDPINTYRGLHTGWLWPPGATVTHINHAYYLSGAEGWIINVQYNDGTSKEFGPFISPSVYGDKHLLLPFSSWTTKRAGSCIVVIDCKRPFSIFAPELKGESYKQTWPLVLENIIFFFFYPSWPDDDSRDPVQTLQAQMRWLWPVLAVVIIALAVTKRSANVLVLMCLVSAFFYCVQQYTVMEGRYRKPWEGVAIACFLSLLYPRPLPEDKKASRT